MTKDVQQQGGVFAQQNAFVGLPRQLTVDTTNWRILLHDGAAQGGIRFVPLTEQLTLFQERSGELDGIADAGWTAPMRGIPVRVGSSVYALRTIVADDGIEVANPNGQGGNFGISLAATIPGNRTASGNWTFQGTATFEDPILGNLTGNTSGNHTGPVLGDVTGNLQGNSEGNHVGGLDARGEALFFDDGQIPAAAVALPAPAPAIPTGCIVDWFGTAGNVPAGWFICDGTNGTPDLRNRFLIGASAENPAHSSGGADQILTTGVIESAGSHLHNVSVDDHILTVAQIPSHVHANGICDNVATLFNHGSVAANPTVAGSVESNGATGAFEGNTTAIGGGTGHNHIAESEAAGIHTHIFVGELIDSLPPFYALYKIMKG